MSTERAWRNVETDDRLPSGELRLDPLLHGRGRVPGGRTAAFDLVAFARALEIHDVAYVLACYATDADIRVVGPDSPPPTARTIRGSRAIQSWLDDADALGTRVTHLVDGGDRVAFTQRWKQGDGTAVAAISTAELQDGLISAQHTILAWARPLVTHGWTRASRDLWTRTE